MNMLPFTITITNQSPVRLCRITSHPPQELDVDVEFLVHSWEIDQLQALREDTRRQPRRQILNESQDSLYEAFIRFLRGIAEPNIFLPTNLLSGYPYGEYCLLLSQTRSRELLDIYNASDRYSQRAVTYGRYNFILNASPQLLDTEAYLIVPNKYTLFLRQVNETSEIQIYRSEFIDLASNTPPPLDFHAQEVIDTIQNSIDSEIEAEPRWRQLFIFPMRQEEEPSATVTECPKCGGEVQRIGGESHFCLNCDWDNLPTLA
jgi:hypothetical protein